MYMESKTKFKNSPIPKSQVTQTPIKEKNHSSKKSKISSSKQRSASEDMAFDQCNLQATSDFAEVISKKQTRQIENEELRLKMLEESSISDYYPNDQQVYDNISNHLLENSNDSLESNCSMTSRTSSKKRNLDQITNSSDYSPMILEKELEEIVNSLPEDDESVCKDFEQNLIQQRKLEQ